MSCTNGAGVFADAYREGETMTSVSTSFYPRAHDAGYNVIVSASDDALFYLNTESILAFSKDAFKSILPDVQSSVIHAAAPQSLETRVTIPEPADVLDAMMHILYRLPYLDQVPPFQTLEKSVYAMPKYHIDPAVHLVPQNPAYQTFLVYAPTHPLELYALAAQFKVDHLAALASSHLLSFPISTLSDEMAARIGAIYVKRLLSLHLNRLNLLRSILLAPPNEHPPTLDCDGIESKKLTSAWAMIAAKNAWEARPDISTNLLSLSFDPLKKETTCDLCQKSLGIRLEEVIKNWANVPCTI